MSDEGTNARLSALDFLVEGLWAKILASLSAEESQALVESTRQASQRWALTPGNPPQDVEKIERDHALVAAWIGHLLQRIQATEALLRRHRSSDGTPREGES